MILELPRILTDEMQPEAAHATRLERGTEIRGGSVGGVERRAAIRILHRDGAIARRQRDGGGAFDAHAAAVPYGVREEFFEREVQPELDVLAQRTIAAELLDEGGEPLQFVETAVQLNFRQNRRL